MGRARREKAYARTSRGLKRKREKEKGMVCVRRSTMPVCDFVPAWCMVRNGAQLWCGRLFLVFQKFHQRLPADLVRVGAVGQWHIESFAGSIGPGVGKAVLHVRETQ